MADKTRPIIHGMPWLSGTTQEMVDTFPKLITKEDEIYIVTYAKSVFYGSWFDHLLGWWKHRDDPRMLFLKYEDMKKDALSAVSKIAQFIGKDLSDDTVARIMDQTSFDTMKKGSHTNYSWNSRLKGEFIRKGQVGDWRNLFTAEQNDRFDKLYQC